MHDISLGSEPAAQSRRANLGMGEFIAMCASLAAVAAMSIDIMLPALPAIGASYGVVDDNSRQLVILVFAVAFAFSQLIYGPLSDRFGRKPLLATGLLLYLAGSVAAPVMPDYTSFLGMRMLQGVGAAALQVTTMAVVRDCFSGQAMGRVLTFVFTTFMIIPIIAPTIGQGIQLASGWQGVFAFNAIAATMILIWITVRLRETLDVADRRSLALGSLLAAFKEICTNRVTAGYAVASTLTLVSLFSYIVSVQQVYGELYGLGALFPLAFGASSIGVAVAALFSARVVRKYGMRPVAHATLAIFTVSGLILLAISLAGNPPFWVTFLFLSLCMMAFGVVQGNVNAIALEPLGHIAGTASSLFGVVTMVIGTTLGGVVGQAYNGTVTPLAFAFGVGGLFAFLAVLWTERGRMFRN